MYKKSDKIRHMLGENIKRLRLSRGYSQEKFAQACDKSQAVISSWEIGIRQPELDVIFELAETFHVPVTALIPVEVTGQDADLSSEVSAMILSNENYRNLFEKVKRVDPEKLSVLFPMLDALAGNSHE